MVCRLGVHAYLDVPLRLGTTDTTKKLSGGRERAGVAGGHGNVKQRASTTHKLARNEVYSES